MARTLNGIGTRYYGSRTLPDGTYITTEWFVIFFFPIFPVRSVRILDASAPSGIPGMWSHQSIKVQKVPLDVRMVLQLYAWIIGGILALFLWAKFFDWMQW